MSHLALQRAAGVVAALALLVLGGCATLSRDGGIDAVQRLARERIGNDATLPHKDSDPAATSAATRELLREPLTAEGAVQIAFLHNATLKASLAELGIGEADLVQAGRLPNPRFSYSNKRNAEVATIDRTLMVSVLSLLTLPLTQAVAATKSR